MLRIDNVVFSASCGVNFLQNPLDFAKKFVGIVNIASKKIFGIDYASWTARQ